MFTILNNIIFAFFFIINIKFCLTVVSDHCDIGEYSTLTMNCKNNKLLNTNLGCTQYREDGLKCWNTNLTSELSEKDFYGKYFDQPQRLAGGNGNYDYIINDIAIYQRITNCNNEYLILCQQLINSCILRLWQDVSNAYCSLLLNKTNTINNLRPILSQDKPSDDGIGISYTLDSDNRNDNRRLNFWVGKFGLNGTFLKFERLEYDFLPCSNSQEGKTDYKYYGNNYIKKCEIYIKKYLNNETSFLYEIFLENNIESHDINLIKIPIKITNIGNYQAYRMFLHYYNSTEDRYIYAEKVKLYVHTLSSDEEYKIQYPYFEVTYNEKRNVRLENIDQTDYTFEAEYKSDVSEFVKAMRIIFWILTAIVIFMVLYRTFVWIQNNPMNIIPNNYILKLLFEFFYKSCKYLGTFYFWFTFGISAYWYFFYKLQGRIYYLMPPTDDEVYSKFKLIFYIGFGCYMMKMFIRIYKQVSFDIFFVDWETEKIMAMNDVKSSLDKHSIKSKRYRSAWRMIHVANQFNQLQKDRIFHLYFGFCWLVILYFRCHWYRREQMIPDDERLDEAPTNFILRNFIASIIVLASVSIELVIVKILQIWIPLKKQEFMDLCSVSNISVFILDEYLHGYYIHGLSPFLKADVNYDELFKYLNQESTGAVRTRGLENDNIEDHNKNQSYEMFLSNAMRVIYDGLYIIQTESMMFKGVNSENYFKKSRLGRRLFRNFLNFEKDQTLLDNYMNNQLKSKLELVSSDVRRYIKDKTFCQRIMGYTINDTGMQIIGAQDLLFYRDYGQNFDDLLFYGMEWEWFVMDLFVFQFFMIILDDVFIPMLLTYLIDNILYYIRCLLGDSNVAKKAVVDDRFLN